MLNFRSQMRSTWLSLSCLIFAISHCVHAQSQLNSLEVQSSWGGLGNAAHSEFSVERKGDGFASGHQSVSSNALNALVAAVAEASISKPAAANLGITPQWRRSHMDEAGSNASRLYYREGLPEQKELFQAAFVDENTLALRLKRVYEHSHTDDYPHMRLELVMSNGSTITLTTDSQSPYMLPWTITTNGTTRETYNAKISHALFVLLPPKFANRERLTEDGLSEMIGEETATTVESRWELIRAEHDSGDALSILRTKYEVHGATVDSYHGLAFGKAWDGGEPHEENLHATLTQPGFPKGFAISAILLREHGKTDGAHELLSTAPVYQKLVLSIPWLDTYLRSHPQENEWMFYVHGESFTDKAMHIFADDMKTVGRNDLIQLVGAVQHQAALLETGYGDYWIILPDKTAIMWRWQSLTHILNWKVGEFPAHECTDYRTVSGGCAGIVISPDGIVEPEGRVLGASSR
jgi:hypothetical protein